MKLFSVVVALLAFSVTSIAQTQPGIFAGVHSSKSRYLINDAKQSTKMKMGFQLGGNIKVPFESRLFFVPSLSYSLKGYDVTFNQAATPPDANAKDNSTTLHTIEISPLLEYDFNSNPSHLFIRFGPSIDVLISGNEKYNLQSGGSVSRKMNIGISGDYGKFGASLIGQFGYETATGLTFYVHYTHGVGNIVNKDGGPKIYNSLFGISVGKYLKKNKIVIDTRNKQ